MTCNRTTELSLSHYLMKPFTLQLRLSCEVGRIKPGAEDPEARSHGQI